MSLNDFIFFQNTDRQYQYPKKFAYKNAFGLFLIISSAITIPYAAAMGSRPTEVILETAPAVQLPPLTLEEAYQAALHRSEELAMAQADIDMTWANFLEASSEALGDVSYQREDFRQEDLGSGTSESGATSSFNRPNTRESKFVISQPLFQGFKSLGALAGSGSLRKEREYTYDRAKQLLFLDVADVFYTVQRYERDLEITQETLKLLGSRVNDLNKREEIGRSRMSEVVTARARLNSLKSTLARIQGSMRVQKRTLEFLTGYNLEGRSLADPENVPQMTSPITGYLEQSENRPDVEAARYALKKANQNIIIAQSEVWPTITLDHTQYDRREGFQGPIDWDMMFKINVPLFQGGEALSKIKAALVDRTKSNLKLTQTERVSEMETKQAYDSLSSRLDEYTALEEAVKTAEENYKVQKKDYRLALVTNLDVLEALENLNQTRLDHNEVHAELLKDYRRLQVASGDCCESI
ncbi:MAG: TolC family protein [Candidatus Omnitrophica bacterium]|nr:TolC family protein [Candidatus Omnitrophota bacterium]